MLVWLFIPWVVLASSTTRSTTVGATRSSVSSSTSSSTSATYDISLHFTIAENDRYFNCPFQVGDDEVQLRLDILQPELWVMNNNSFFNCSYINSWWNSESSLYSQSTVFPEQVTTASEYLADVCAAGGRYVAPTDPPTPTIAALSNGQPYVVPYINILSASGEWETNNVSVNLTNGSLLTFDDFTFVNVNESSISYGGLGLAGTPVGSGFLYSLYNQGLIRSPGYSIFFNNNTADLIPGIIDKKFYSGDFLSYKNLPHDGLRFNDNAVTNEQIGYLNIPSIQLDNIQVTNEITQQSINLNTDPLPMILDTRSTYNYVPLDVLVNLAMQTNAYYSNDAERWIVQCQTIQTSNSTLNFNIGSLNIKVPLSEFIETAVYSGKSLKFKGGQQACFLTFLPTNFNGVDSLGLRVLKYLYLAVDNQGENIALALANHSTDTDGDIETSTLANSSNQTTFDYIKSGTIPFATTTSYDQTSTITYTPITDGTFNGGDIPARFTGAVISGNEIYIFGDNSMYSTVSAATEKSTQTMTASAANILPHSFPIFRDLTFMSTFYTLIFSITFIGFILL